MKRATKIYANNSRPKDNPELEQVIGSSYCQFSIVENKLATLYRNQEKIYSLLKKLFEEIT